ncbi:hypothetical protein HII12_001283 [Brettanomyces bruxellensis]|uniref:PCI domain-containing protein n=1 Tax=Dekkera bruxellensis TaxID=5007 RepID=A0A8H6BND7_DEKBR|nr:hypothetical protein HII12_001283 [Brettanomyces bruxellensis]
MSFTVVLDRYLNESVTEYGAILDLELRTTDHKYQNEFNELLQNDNKDALLAKLVDSAKVFLKNMGDNAFEPTANLYINTIDSLTSEMDVDVLGPIESAVKNLGVEQYIASKSNVKPTSVISVLSNVFNFVPETSRLRVLILQQIVDLASRNYLQSLLSPTIAKNFLCWILKVEDADTEDVRKLANQIFAEIYTFNQTEALTFYSNLLQNENLESAFNAEDRENFVLKALSAKKYFAIKDAGFSSKLNDPALAQLLVLIQTANLKEFNTFISTSEGKSLSVKLDLDTLSLRVKCTAIPKILETLSEESGKHAFGYEEIAKEICVSGAEVEEILIECIQQGFITGRLSQPEEILYLNRVNSAYATNAPLTAEEWQKAGKYLQKWSVTIDGLQSLIKNLISKNGKRMLPPEAIQIFHQQKQEMKEQMQKERERRQEQDKQENIELEHKGGESQTATAEEVSVA